MKLPLLFSEGFDAPIWEMHLNKKYLLISTRNQKILEVTFHLFDIESKEFLWRDLVFEEPWWIGVTHFYDDTIVFHTYQNSQDLESKSIFGFNWIEKEVVWVHEGCNPIRVIKSDVFCEKTGGDIKEIFRADIKKGTKVILKELPAFDQKKKNVMVSKPTQNPLHYVEGTTAFESVAKYLKLKQNIDIVGACDYLEHNDRIVISYFEEKKEGKENTMLVLDKELNMIDFFILSSGLSGLASDTFFIVNEALIFVRNRSQFMGLLI